MRYTVSDQVVTLFPDNDSVSGRRQVERKHGPLDASEPHSQMSSYGGYLGRWHSRTSSGRPICLRLSGAQRSEKYRRSVQQRARTLEHEEGWWLVQLPREDHVDQILDALPEAPGRLEAPHLGARDPAPSSVGIEHDPPAVLRLQRLLHRGGRDPAEARALHHDAHLAVDPHRACLLEPQAHEDTLAM